MKRMIVPALALWAVLVLTSAARAEDFRVYWIGNSVTDTLNYNALKSMAATRDHNQIWGRQMIPGAPLSWLWDHPTDGFMEQPFGYPSNALPNYTWDAISLQPFDRLLPSDQDYAGRFIDLALQNPANRDTQFYIYSRWPRKNSDGSLPYAQLWDRPYTGGWDNTNETRDYFEKLLGALRTEYAPTLSKPILMVPVGDVLYELDKRMEAGQVPGFTDIIQLYADGIHFTNVGRFVVGTTFYATLYKDDPRGLSGAAYNITDPALVAVIQDTVWDIVSTHPLSGVSAPLPALPGDADGNGRVDDADLNVLLSHWGDSGSAVGWAQGDFNADHAVTDADLNLLLSRWGDTAAIPEPASLALLALLSLALPRR